MGQPLTTELKARGHDVYGIDLRHSDSPKVTRCDIANWRQVEEVFIKVKPDLVYNLAAEFGRVNGEHFFEQLWTANQIGNQNIIHACVKYNAKFILAGSSEAYGDADVPILSESLAGTDVPNFHNQYALSKWTQEQQVFIAVRNEGLKAVVLRFFNAYGPGEYYSPYRSVVCLFCFRILAGLPITVYKDYHRVFMYVTDWARTVANVADRFDSLPTRGGFNETPLINVGGTEYRSVEDLANVISRIARVPADINLLTKEDHNVTNKCPSVDLARQYLDHDPSITLEEGVASTVAWMRETYAFDEEWNKKAA